MDWMAYLTTAILAAIPVYIFSRKHLLSELYNIDEWQQDRRFKDMTWNEYTAIKKLEYRRQSSIHALMLKIYDV